MPPHGSFLEWAANFPQQDVVIVHAAETRGERRTPARTAIVGQQAFFNIDTPVYEGDVIEASDPRGGTRRLIVDMITINDARDSTFDPGMSHIQADFSEGRPRSAGHTTNYHGPVTNVTAGAYAQVAVGNGNVHQRVDQAVAQAFEELAEAVRRALDVITTDASVGDDDRQDAEVAAGEVLNQLSQTQPDQGVVRRALAGIRGILATTATAAASEAGRTLITSLVLPG